MQAKKVVGMLVMVMGAISAEPGRAEQNVTIDGVDWRVNYTGDFFPNDPQSDPAWTDYFVSPGATATVEGGILTFDAPANIDQAWAEMINTTYWDGNLSGSHQNTVEFRMRLQSSAVPYTAAGISIFDGVRYFSFQITEDDPFSPGEQGYVTLGDGGQIVLDVDTYHVFRVVTDGTGTANLFINGIDAYGFAVGANGDSGDNRVNFGDLTSGGGGMSQWDYFRWTNAGAFDPVPEPGVSELLFLGAAAGAWGWRRRMARREAIRA